MALKIFLALLGPKNTLYPHVFTFYCIFMLNLAQNFLFSVKNRQIFLKWRLRRQKFCPRVPILTALLYYTSPIFFNIIFYNKANCSLSFFPQHKERIRGESSEQEKKKLTKYVDEKKSWATNHSRLL